MTNLSIKLYGFIQGLLTREEGQDLLEYVLLGGMIALAIVTVAVLFTGSLTDMVNNIGDCLDFSSTTTCSPGF